MPFSPESDPQGNLNVTVAGLRSVGGTRNERGTGLYQDRKTVVLFFGIFSLLKSSQKFILPNVAGPF